MERYDPLAVGAQGTGGGGGRYRAASPSAAAAVPGGLAQSFISPPAAATPGQLPPSTAGRRLPVAHRDTRGYSDDFADGTEAVGAGSSTGDGAEEGEDGDEGGTGEGSGRASDGSMGMSMGSTDSEG